LWQLAFCCLLLTKMGILESQEPKGLLMRHLSRMVTTLCRWLPHPGHWKPCGQRDAMTVTAAARPPLAVLPA
jgi:hypothetical protein